jgi:hypothetical protein
LNIPTGPLLIAATVVINIPFGAYRFTVDKFSWKWFVAIHVPIPAIFILRTASHHGYDYIPWLVAAAVAGQIIGSRLFGLWHTRRRRGLIDDEITGEDHPPHLEADDPDEA